MNVKHVEKRGNQMLAMLLRQQLTTLFKEGIRDGIDKFCVTHKNDAIILQREELVNEIIGCLGDKIEDALVLVKQAFKS